MYANMYIKTRSILFYQAAHARRQIFKCFALRACLQHFVCFVHSKTCDVFIHAIFVCTRQWCLLPLFHVLHANTRGQLNKDINRPYSNRSGKLGVA